MAFGLDAKPRQDAGQGDLGGEIPGSLVIAGCQASKLLELGYEILDQVAKFVSLLVERARMRPGDLRRDDWDSIPLADEGQHSVRVIPFVGKDPTESIGVKQGLGLGTVVNLPSRQNKVQWVAVTIGDQVDFSGQASSRTTEVLTPPFCPAACWWARMEVESNMTMTISKSSLGFKASMTVRQTPRLLQRLKRVKTVFHGNPTSGMSRQGAPVRCFQRMTSTISRLGRRWGPGPPVSGGNRGASRSHISSVRKLRAIPEECCHPGEGAPARRTENTP